VLIVFRDTTLFNGRAFAFTLLGATLVWVAAQARAHSRAKILYVEPDPSSGSLAASARPSSTGGDRDA
jgi:ATP synthase protein I